MVTMMLGALMLPAQAAGDAPAKLELFANEQFYKSQKGEEQTFTGTLMRVEKKGGGIGIGRFNPYYLVMETGGKKTTREVYGGGKPDVLAPYVGKQVKITGKAVDMEVIGKIHNEIWPARLEVILAEKKNPAPAEAA